MIRIRVVAGVLVASLIVLSPLLVYRIYIPPGFNLTLQRILLLISVLAAFLILLQRKVQIRRDGLLVLLPFALYACYLGIGFARSHLKVWAYRQLLIVLCGLVLVSLFSLFSKWIDVRSLIPLVWVGSLLPVALGLYEFAICFKAEAYRIPFYEWTIALGESPYTMERPAGYFELTEWGSFRRVSSTLATPPYGGEYFALVFCALLGWVLFTPLRARTRFFCYAYLPILAALVFATLSRSAWILWGLGVLAVLGIYALNKRLPLSLAKVIVLLAIIVAAASFAVPGHLLAEKWAAFINFDDESTLVHTETRLQAFTLFLKFPLAGAGLGNFGYYYHTFPSSHSTFFNELADGGMIGVLLLYSFLFLLLYCLWKRAQLSRVVRPDLYGTLIGTFVTVFLIVFNNVFIYDSLFRDTNLLFMAVGAAVISMSNGAFLQQSPESGVHSQKPRPAERRLRSGRTSSAQR